MRRFAFIPVFLGVTAASATLHAQTPAGPEFLVSAYTTWLQGFPAVASDDRGRILVAWQATEPGGLQGVFARRYDAAGGPQGAQFRVSTYTTFAQGAPSVVADARGNFLVVWSGGATSSTILARRYDRAGTALGSELTLRAGLARPPFAKVAADMAGNFVVVWTALEAGSFEVFGRRFDATGTPRGAEFQVNTHTTNNQLVPAVAADASGRFVVVWVSEGQDGSWGGVFGQRYDSAGTALGSEFQVNTYTTLPQLEPAVASDPQGSFVVAWTSNSGQDGSEDGVFAQRYDAQGAPMGGEFRVNSYVPGSQNDPSVAIDATGNVTVTWRSYPGQDGDGSGVFGQRFDRAGVPRGGEFGVNTYTTHHQSTSRVAVDAVGNAIVVWHAAHSWSGLNPTEIRAQRFGGLVPSVLAVDGPANAVWEPGETVELKPSWHNVGGTAQTFDGVLSALQGPAGATYTIADDSATYGTVPNGATAACSECYAVVVSDPATRPALHWDASAQESITPDAQGQVKRWTLHIGRSFTDVPAASPFYRFVEALLHHGVTTGCGATSYCPGSSTSREQMPVFVLAAEEGAGYAPPACTTPAFSDVPASSPFCPWIEELARRGVVAGCGGGNFCPGEAVTREQMAVFVLRTLDPALDPPGCTAPLFGDLPASSPFCRWVEELVRRGVVAGCGGGNYCPGDAVTREQMSVFISATFRLALYGP